MATTKVKNIKKVEWQEMATSHGIQFTEKNEVRYLVEKIAEKIGVDDKIVKLDDLKQAVCDKLWASESNTSNTEVVENVTTKNETLEETSNVDAELFHYRNEARRLGVIHSHEQTTNDLIQLLDYHCQQNPPVTYIKFGNEVETPSAPVDRLEELRAECTRYGLGYAPFHKVEDLEQLLNAVRGIVQPISNDSFELSADTFADVVSKTPSAPVTPIANNPISGVNMMPQVNMTTPNSELDKYRILFTQTIRGHFRLMSIAEIKDMIERDRYPFSYSINTNPNQNNLIEITFTSGGNSVRLPSEDRNDWLSING